jgi:NADPH:quinone reductase-like Zn-dependent oxidoreductase
MKAAVIHAAGESPVLADFREPAAAEGMEVITVSASALSPLSRARSSGRHYSSQSPFPAVAGVDGVGRTASGKRVYFALPEAPFGALAEKCLVDARRCIPVPESLDDVTAAALANPGMSAMAALMERARLVRGETVLVNGATGSAGTLAVQLAKYQGAGKVIATGRNHAELERLRTLGADVVLVFALEQPQGLDAFEEALKSNFAHGVDVVLDYLWGASAETIIAAIAKAQEDARPVRFVQIGSAGGQETIALPSAALRSSAIQLMGSGLKSVEMAKLLQAISRVFDAAVATRLELAVKAMPLSAIEEAWKAPGKPRIVITIGERA